MVGKDVVAEAKRAVETFFEVFESGTVVGLILPDGWLGRPYDNYYELQDVSASGDLLEADLGWGWKLSLKPSSVVLSDDFCALTIEGSQIAASTIDSSWRYDAGYVRFVVSETSTTVRNIIAENRYRLDGLGRVP